MFDKPVKTFDCNGPILTTMYIESSKLLGLVTLRRSARELHEALDLSYKRKKVTVQSEIQLNDISKYPYSRYTLRCHRRISSPEKGLNSTRKNKTIFFSRVFDIANQLLTRHSPFAPHSQVVE